MAGTRFNGGGSLGYGRRMDDFEPIRMGSVNGQPRNTQTHINEYGQRQVGAGPAPAPAPVARPAAPAVPATQAAPAPLTPVAPPAQQRTQADIGLGQGAGYAAMMDARAHPANGAANSIFNADGTRKPHGDPLLATQKKVQATAVAPMQTAATGTPPAQVAGPTAPAAAPAAAPSTQSRGAMIATQPPAAPTAPALPAKTDPLAPSSNIPLPANILQTRNPQTEGSRAFAMADKPTPPTAAPAPALAPPLAPVETPDARLARVMAERDAGAKQMAAQEAGKPPEAPATTIAQTPSAPPSPSPFSPLINGGGAMMPSNPGTSTVTASTGNVGKSAPLAPVPVDNRPIAQQIGAALHNAPGQASQAISAAGDAVADATVTGVEGAKQLAVAAQKKLSAAGVAIEDATGRVAQTAGRKIAAGVDAAGNAINVGLDAASEAGRKIKAGTVAAEEETKRQAKGFWQGLSTGR